MKGEMMNSKSTEPLVSGDRLKSIQELSLQSLMELEKQEMQELLYHLDREIFEIQLQRDWLDTALQIRLWIESQEELKEKEVSNVH